MTSESRLPAVELSRGRAAALSALLVLLVAYGAEARHLAAVPTGYSCSSGYPPLNSVVKPVGSWCSSTARLNESRCANLYGWSLTDGTAGDRTNERPATVSTTTKPAKTSATFNVWVRRAPVSAAAGRTSASITARGYARSSRQDVQSPGGREDHAVS